ncbi:TonB-dependent receptor [Novosphingobium profundi]|uniref:TonB-dependent receptor n=1 Tax=Novosphingobium profundi TaxID=1774954 RepID=UPI001BD94171|nr:TonB-dependent receptor [Novosphingobium profundi]MBT0670038.1 TonB-dependent receptor [Novosphingobium profundi]
MVRSKRTRKTPQLAGTISFVVLSSLASPALAQSRSSDAVATGGAPSGDIIVTARRSEERIQDVPLTLSALSSEAMAEKGVTDLQDIANATPGLRFTDFLSKFNGNAVIRGLSQTNVQSAVGNTGVFIDGIYLQRGYMVDSQLADMQRIEIVKGPQSALYGQNTFSGAINYVLNQPSDELKVDGYASLGNAGYSDLRAGIGGPIIPGILAGRIYYARSQYEGTWKNNFPGADSAGLGHFGGYHRQNFSGSLKLTPTQGMSITGTYYRLTRREKIRAFYTIDGNLLEDQLNCGNKGTNGSYYLWCGNLPASPDGKRSGLNADNYPEGLFTVPQPGMRAKTEMIHVAGEYAFAPAWTFNYDYGHVEGEGIEQSSFASNSWYLDASSYRVAGTTPSFSLQREAGTLTYDSHDARLTFDDGGALSFDFGYFHSFADDSFLFGLTLGQQAGVPITSDNWDPSSAGDAILFNNRTTQYRTDSGYGRVAYKLFDERVTLGAEARYTHTHLRTVDNQTPDLAPLTASYDNLTPRFSLRYEPSPDFMVYASAAKGVKAGGFNGYVTGSITLTQDERSYGEEENWTYEVGTKGSALNNRLFYTLAAFYIDWSKRQIGAPPSGYVPPTDTNSGGGAVPGIYVSGGAAESYGLEFSGNYQLADALSLNATFAWQHATAKEGAVAPTASSTCDDVVCNSNGDVSGNYLGNVPQFQGTFGFEYKTPVTDTLEFFLAADEIYRGKMYTDETNTASIAPYALTNGRVGVRAETWKAFFWVKNLLDKSYVEASFVVPSIYQYNVNLGEQRTFGVTATFNY